jgi:hypothetical protein
VGEKLNYLEVSHKCIMSLNLKYLPEGIYYLNLQGDGVNIIKKIVIQ